MGITSGHLLRNLISNPKSEGKFKKMKKTHSVNHYKEQVHGGEAKVSTVGATVRVGNTWQGSNLLINGSLLPLYC